MLAGVAACEHKGAAFSGSAQALSISVDTAHGAANPAIVVSGFSGVELAALQSRASTATWSSVFAVAVTGHPETNVAGAYQVRDSLLVFEPRFPFDAGRAYAVRVDSRALFPPRQDTLSVVVTPRARGSERRVTTVRRILPSGDTVPENLLRLYIEFSAPMSRVSGLDFVHLVDSAGREVPHAFLPLDADFWNDDLTRYTVFLDPGRVKRGILPNEQLGRAIREGRRYAIVVDSAWPDANNLMLVATSRKLFAVKAADTSRIALDRWKVDPPPAQGRVPLVITFPMPLDHGLLKRTLGVAMADGRPVAGTVDIGAGEQSWRFTPTEPWRAGRYTVVIFSSLEDPAGNRIDRPFEVDMFQRVDSTTAPERYRLAFTVR